MNFLLLLLAIFGLSVGGLWTGMAVKLYKRRGGSGILRFLLHGVVAFLIVAIIWMFLIWPVFFFEEDYPVNETILFFAVIILILGAWPLLADYYFKKNPVEEVENQETLDSVVEKSINETE